MADPPRYEVRESACPTYDPPTSPPIVTPEAAYEACRSLARQRVEVFQALLLDARHRLIRKVTVSRGTISASLVHPREVFRTAIVASASAMIVVHNHPSQDPEPSRDDLELTRRLVQVGDLVGIPVLDHMIVVKTGYLSLKQEGRM